MPKGAQMSVALNELKLVALHSNSNIYYITCGKKLLTLYAKQPMENHGGLTLETMFHWVRRITLLFLPISADALITKHLAFVFLLQGFVLSLLVFSLVLRSSYTCYTPMCLILYVSSGDRSNLCFKTKAHPRNWRSFVSGDVTGGVLCLLHGVKSLWMAPKWSNGLLPFGYCQMCDLYSILFEFWFLSIPSYVSLAGLDYLLLLIMLYDFWHPSSVSLGWTLILIIYVCVYIYMYIHTYINK